MQNLMSGWNHRVLAHKDGDNWCFQIHEVYYDDEGKPNGYTLNSVSVSAETPEGIHWVLEKMKECTTKPILSVENFPEEWNPD